MFFPVGDDNVVGGAKPYFCYLFLFINIAVFLYQINLPEESMYAFVRGFGAIPQDIVSGSNYFTLFTSMFLHGGFLHIIGNMLFLWVFADNIEATLGNFTFALFYILGGLFASAAHIISGPLSEIPTVGASGAIAAVLGAYIVLFPKSRIRIRFLIFKPFVIPALAFLGIWFAQNLLSGMGSLGVDTSQTGGTAWWAHIGGFVFGLAMGFLAKRFYTSEPNIA